MSFSKDINSLKGPILIIGASGFVGANLLKKIKEYRDDVFGTAFSGAGWRFKDSSSILHMNICDINNVNDIFKKVEPKTIFDCSSFGAYSFEDNIDLIHKTNYLSLIQIFEMLEYHDISAYIHAGSSSEYGLNSASPSENSSLVPNSQYAISKASASNAITFYGKIKNLPIINLRLYSVYGPFEDSSRLIPVLCKKTLEMSLPEFADKKVSRDFIYIDDVVEAFIASALRMRSEIYGESFNIGTGKKTYLEELAMTSKSIFNISSDPIFNSNAGRIWDTEDWYADIEKSKEYLNWHPKISLEEGLKKTQEWWKVFLKERTFNQLTKKGSKIEKNSITAIIACYKDEQAIPIMHERLVNVFSKNKIDYEIIFVNDCSPDDSHSVIKNISSKDPRVIGITHSRNFGSQSAFLSGMEMATKESCVLLDGDLQDPPELITEFIKKWRRGYDVVYGRRIKREMPFFIEFFYKGFYTILNRISDLDIPKNAGDFSLIDKKAMHWILECNEKDFFLRGIRAFIGFNQSGVNYYRAERVFGVSTNSWIKNFGWAKKAIFSFSTLPLHILTFIGVITVVATLFLASYSIFIKLSDPLSAPSGITFLSLLVMFFGSFCILGIGLLGEYIGKILEESKSRPRYIRDKVIIRGIETNFKN
jgi:polyisoprenyl-phosphate glycosyltransferase